MFIFLETEPTLDNIDRMDLLKSVLLNDVIGNKNKLIINELYNLLISGKIKNMYEIKDIANKNYNKPIIHHNITFKYVYLESHNDIIEKQYIEIILTLLHEPTLLYSMEQSSLDIVLKAFNMVNSFLIDKTTLESFIRKLIVCKDNNNSYKQMVIRYYLLESNGEHDKAESVLDYYLRANKSISILYSIEDLVMTPLSEPYTLNEKLEDFKSIYNNINIKNRIYKEFLIYLDDNKKTFNPRYVRNNSFLNNTLNTVYCVEKFIEDIKSIEMDEKIKDRIIKIYDPIIMEKYI